MRHAWARMHNGPPGRRRLPDIILERCRITAHLLVLVRCPWRVEQRLQGWHPRVPAEQALEHRSEEHTSELQSRFDLVCRLLLEKKKKKMTDSRIVAKREERMRSLGNVT